VVKPLPKRPAPLPELDRPLPAWLAPWVERLHALAALLREACARPVVLAAGATLLAVLLPLPLLLPYLNDHAVLAWHVSSTLDIALGQRGPVQTLLSVYVAVLLLRFVGFLVGSAIDAAAQWRREQSETLAFDRAGAAAQLTLPSGRAWPFVSIVVPAYNEGPVIRQSIRSLLTLDYPAYEVLVIDDGSSDDTFLRALEEAEGQPRVRVLRKPNGGKSSALNLGLAQARGSLVLNMDADSKLSANALRVCAQHFEDPAIGAVAGNIKVANRENLVTRLQAIEYIQGLSLERRTQSALRAVSVIGGPLGLFRREALLQSGGYDHDTFAEDRDLTLKLLGLGWSVTYEPRAVAECESPSRWLDLLSQRYRWTRGTVQCVLKQRSALTALRQRPTLCLSLWYMAIDSLLVPLVSLFMLGWFMFSIVVYGHFDGLFLWWLLASMFDVTVTAYALALDREDPRLLPDVLLYRFYAIFSDIAKLIATAEELFHLEMNWGKLTREGKI
jgi:cellulose synthase/poly-beta-1,6-N-acetylglucosamine synthase-like glycosyltransferase